MKITIAPSILENQDCIAVKIAGFDPEFPVLMRKIPGARWIPEQKAWVVLRSISPGTQPPKGLEDFFK